MNVLMMVRVTEREAKPPYYRHAGLAHNVNLLRKMLMHHKTCSRRSPSCGTSLIFLYFAVVQVQT